MMQRLIQILYTLLQINDKFIYLSRFGFKHFRVFNNQYSIINCFILIMFLFVSCDVTKHVPQDRYFLKEAKLELDTKEISSSSLTSFIQQHPNDPKPAVIFYNYAAKDTGKWFRRFIGKAGQKPVAYDEKLAALTTKNLRVEMANRGFFHAQIDTSLEYVKRHRNKAGKISVTYHITSNEPYRINTYDIQADDTRIDAIMKRRNRRQSSEIKPGVIFDMESLEAERTMVSQLLRNVGYYSTSKETFHYLADTTQNKNKVDLTMRLRDSIPPKLYRIRHVNVLSGYDPFAKTPFRVKDSLEYEGLHIFFDSTYFMRPAVLRKNILMNSGSMYSEFRDRQTFNHLNSLGCISRTNIRYNELTSADQDGPAMLDCEIQLTQGNRHGIQTGIDGTNKAGNYGMAATLSYDHYNLFNGGERLNIKLRGAYEFVSASLSDSLKTSNYYELGIGTTLSFPQSHIPFLNEKLKQSFTTHTDYGVNFNIQKRAEYTREFFNLNWKQRLENRTHTTTHTISLIDINYVMMPVMSKAFEEYLSRDINSLARFSYDDIFTAGVGYSLMYVNDKAGRYKQGNYSVRLSFESSGNLLNAVSNLSGAEKSENGQYEIFGNPYAQYLKGDFDFAQTFRLDLKHAVVIHTALGLAYPYGNSDILPFEKRYFAGGPNNVRGWSVRQLGPGSYYGTDREHPDRNNPVTHVGDIRLTANAEYRYKWMKWLELAAFVDAGNIWTIREYDNQTGGKFEWDRFHREIALGCGTGIRIDLGFLIIRIDGGKRIYDPARAEGQRWTFFEKFRHNSAMYLAIGYPF